MKKRFINRLVDSTQTKAAVLEPYQFKDLLLVANDSRNGLRNIAIIWHSFGSALRITEIAHLKIKDVLDRDGTVIKVGTLSGKYTKTGKSRSLIQVEKKQQTAIKKYLEQRVGKGLRTTERSDYMGLDPESPLYLSRGQSGFSLTLKTYQKENGELEEYWSCSSLQQLISKLIKRVGVVGGSTHSGRRTLATRLNARGISDDIIQDILGHSCKNQTMDYIEPDLKKIEFALSTIFKEAFIGKEG